MTIFGSRSVHWEPDCHNVGKAVERNRELPEKSLFRGPQKAIRQWIKLGASQDLVNTIRKGVPANMVSFPRPYFRPSPPQQSQILDGILKDYVAQEAVVPLEAKVQRKTKFWTPIFGRQKRDGPWRLITDLRRLNECCMPIPFRPDTWKSLVTQLEQKVVHWGVTLDMKSFFHHLMLSPALQRWCRVYHNDVAYQVRAMPFGLQTAPAWAWRLAKPIVAHMRKRGTTLVWYVDDVALLGETPTHVMDELRYLVDLLTKLRVKINFEKSDLKPRQQLNFLGMVVDLEHKSIFPQPQSLVGALKLNAKLAKAKKATPKDLATLAGKVTDLARGLNNVTGLPRQLMKAAGKMAYAQQKFLPIAKAWKTPKFLAQPTRLLLTEILGTLQQPVGKNFNHPQKELVEIFVDASPLGWGGWLVRKGQTVKAWSEGWSAKERKLHSTHQENQAARKTLQKAENQIPEGAHVLLHSDCQSVVHQYNKGTTIKNLNQIVLEVMGRLRAKNVTLQAVWIKGEHNVWADKLSRRQDPQDYKLRTSAANHVMQCLGRPDIDLFASRLNHQVPRYGSLVDDPRSEGNTWQLQWGTYRLPWVNPPWEDIPQVLNKVIRDKARVLAVLPLWRTRPWFATVCHLMASRMIVLEGELFRNPEGRWMEQPRWKLMAAVLDGTKSVPKDDSWRN